MLRLRRQRRPVVRRGPTAGRAAVSQVIAASPRRRTAPPLCTRPRTRRRQHRFSLVQRRGPLARSVPAVAGLEARTESFSNARSSPHPRQPVGSESGPSHSGRGDALVIPEPVLPQGLDGAPPAILAHLAAVRARSGCHDAGPSSSKCCVAPVVTNTGQQHLTVATSV